MSEETASPPGLREPKGVAGTLLSGWCFALSAVHLVNAVAPFLSDFDRNVMHFAGFAVLAAALYPAASGAWARSRAATGADLVLAALAVASAFWFVVHETRLYGETQPFGALDWAAAILLVIGATEFTRRVAGPVIPILIVISLTYIAEWGSMIDGVFQFRGFSWESTLWRSIYNDEGIFGTVARISSTTVFLFIIFGAFLVRSGAGDFVIALATAVAGRVRGGPGIVAVISSGLTGTISGSAVANTASTGVITIPLMKKAGFQPKFAGGVEAAASTGGQLMPPIMGAGAFVMASFTQIPYETIVATAALPALLYFLSVGFFVRIEACRLNLPPLEAEGETLWTALKRGGAPFIVPISLLITMLVMGFTPNYAAVFGIGAVIVASWASANPMGPRAIFEALALGARSMVMTAVLLCAVGLVVNVITTAGVGNVFSLMIDRWADGNLLLAIAMVALASLVLGMGLPVTAAYIVLATLSAPAIAGMIGDREVIALIAAGDLPSQAQAIFMLGAPEAVPRLAAPMPLPEARTLVHSLPIEVAQPLREMVVPAEAATVALLSAHMIIFWLSQDSNVTPPVALAAFTAAAIARSPAMATGVASWKLAKGLYIVPVLFAYTPFLSGDWGAALTVFAFGVVGIYGLSAALAGAMEGPISWPLRLAAGAAGLGALWPDLLLVNIAGAALVLVLLGWSIRTAPAPRTA
ncbi:MAG: TRAP transporter fused permease subunit [Paracoccaceae bacterium]|jgi:TRAP transporter 4TM/12TM fusion protein|nr:TRAP transporter fused permease subunit [Paracoccaceae bacterium]